MLVYLESLYTRDSHLRLTTRKFMVGVCTPGPLVCRAGVKHRIRMFLGLSRRRPCHDTRTHLKKRGLGAGIHGYFCAFLCLLLFGYP